MITTPNYDPWSKGTSVDCCLKWAEFKHENLKLVLITPIINTLKLCTWVIKEYRKTMARSVKISFQSPTNRNKTQSNLIVLKCLKDWFFCVVMHNAIPAIPSAEVEADTAEHLHISQTLQSMDPIIFTCHLWLGQNHLPCTRLHTCAQILK